MFLAKSNVLFLAKAQRRKKYPRSALAQLVSFELVSEVVDYSCDSIFDQGFIEINQKTQFHIGEFLSK